MAHLTDPQNERLRLAIREYQAKAGLNDRELAGLLGVEGGSFSRFINRRGGAAFSTAQAAAKLLKRKVDELLGPPERRAGERLELMPSPEAIAPASAALEMRAITFWANLRRMPGLEAWIANHPSSGLTVAGLTSAMIAFDALPRRERNDDSDRWWTTFLAPYVPGGDDEEPQRRAANAR